MILPPNSLVKLCLVNLRLWRRGWQHSRPVAGLQLCCEALGTVGTPSDAHLEVCLGTSILHQPQAGFHGFGQRLRKVVSCHSLLKGSSLIAQDEFNMLPGVLLP